MPKSLNTNFGYSVQVNYVGFGNGINIISDNGTPYSTNSSIPDWSPTNKKAIAFVSTTTLSAAAHFVGCDFSVPMQVKGILRQPYAIGTVEFPAKALVTKTSHGLIYGEYPMTQGTLGTIGGLPVDIFPNNTVDYIQNASIEWYITLVGLQSWNYIGATTHDFYITHKEPISTPVYLSALHWGCKNAKGETSPSEIVDKMFNEFTDRKVTRVGTTNNMTYWGGLNCNNGNSRFADCFTTANLLKYGDGRCGAWADLFKTMIETQGITGSNIASLVVADRYIPPLQPQAPCRCYPDNIFNLFSADFSAQGLNPLQYSPMAKKAVDNTPHLTSIFFVKKWAMTLERKFYDYSTNATDDEAQGTGSAGTTNYYDPQPFFNDHAVVEFIQKVYDPSYGKSYSDFQIWELDNVEGVGAIASKNPISPLIIQTWDNADVANAKYWLYKKSTSTAINLIKE